MALGVFLSYILFFLGDLPQQPLQGPPPGPVRSLLDSAGLHPWLLLQSLPIDRIFPMLKPNILNVLFGSLLQALALAVAEGGRHGSRTTLNN